MKKQVLPIVFILVVMFTVGCATYKVGDKTFHSSSEGLQEQTKILSRELAGITPIDTPVHGTALVLLPSNMEIRKNYISFGLNEDHSEEQIKYVITTTKNDFQFAADAIRKKSIFDSVAVAYQNGNPASFPMGGYDYLVFVDVDGWFLRGRNNPKPLLVAFPKDRPKLFLDSLQEQAKALRGN